MGREESSGVGRRTGGMKDSEWKPRSRENLSLKVAQRPPPEALRDLAGSRESVCTRGCLHPVPSPRGGSREDPEWVGRPSVWGGGRAVCQSEGPALPPEPTPFCESREPTRGWLSNRCAPGPTLGWQRTAAPLPEPRGSPSA